LLRTVRHFIVLRKTGFPHYSNTMIPQQTALFRIMTTFSLALVMLLTGTACRETAPPPPADIVKLDIPLRDLAPPQIPPLTPEPSARLDKRFVPECSGFVASKKFPGVFWTHSDSGNPATLVAIRADGSVVKPRNAGSEYTGVKIAGATNKDWEAVTIDAAGRILIADTGNNDSVRKDLRLLAFPEPDPTRDTQVTPEIIAVRHLDQTDFLKTGHKRYDCESIFCWKGSVYVFTKRWTDSWSVLCRLQMAPGGKEGVFIPVTAFNARGLVTDAAISPDGRRLAVLTYHNVWLFTLPTEDSDKAGVPPTPISGKAHYYPIQFPLNQWQAEAISFIDENRVLIGAEQGVLFTLDLSKIPEAGK
jgi:hypothetical protein